MSATATHDIVVVDTDVVSFLFKGDTRAGRYRPRLNHRLRLIAAQTRAELELWALTRNWGARRRDALRLFLKDFALAEADETTSVLWAEVQDAGRRLGRPVSLADAWVAATALAYAAPLVTNNPDDFAHVLGLTVITEK